MELPEVGMELEEIASHPSKEDRSRVKLKLKNGTYIGVSEDLLVNSSTVFKRIIIELNQSIVEVEDFPSELVVIFVATLEKKSVDFEIVAAGMQDFLKLSSVFKVEWLVAKCEQFIMGSIERIENENFALSYDEILKWFKLAIFLKEKYGKYRFMSFLISKLLSLDQNICFLRQYIEESEDFKDTELDIILEMAGTNSEIVLTLILSSIDKRKTLGRHVVTLLNKMNTEYCMRMNEGLFREVFEEITKMENLSCSEVREMLKLYIDTTKCVMCLLRQEKTLNLDPEGSFQLQKALFESQSESRTVIDAMVGVTSALLSYESSDSVNCTEIWNEAMVKMKDGLLRHQSDDLYDAIICIVRFLEFLSQSVEHIASCQQNDWYLLLKDVSPSLGYTRVNTTFLDGIIVRHPTCRDFLYPIRDSPDLASYTCSQIFSCEVSKGQNRGLPLSVLLPRSGSVPHDRVTLHEFLAYPSSYPFHFIHPCAQSCIGTCGFVLRVLSLDNQQIR